MSAYLIAQIAIHDPVEYQEYAKAARKTFSGYKLEVLVADEGSRLVEGEWPHTKTVVFRFEDEAEALRWYNSPEYQEAMKIRHRASVTNLIIAKGLR